MWRFQAHDWLKVPKLPEDLMSFEDVIHTKERWALFHCRANQYRLWLCAALKTYPLAGKAATQGHFQFTFIILPCCKALLTDIYLLDGIHVVTHVQGDVHVISTGDCESGEVFLRVDDNLRNVESERRLC